LYDEPVVLVTSRGSGSGKLHETSEPAFVTNNSFAVVPKCHWLSRHYLKEALLRGDIPSLVTGSAQPQLTVTNFSDLEIVVPTEDVVREFHKFADALWSKTKANLDQQATLAKIRDTLLPKLMSGELRVA